MNEKKFASLESQLSDSFCDVDDTEEMFWLRESDDYASCFTLGGALAGQYRFKEAIEVYEKALRIRQDDNQLYYRLGAANLTLFRFEKAMLHYRHCFELGMDKKSLAFPLGIWHYLKGEYEKATEMFSGCMPCDAEMEIAVIYWHTLSSYRLGIDGEMLKEYHSDMQVGHHTAYKAAVSTFCGESVRNDAINEISKQKSDLDYIIALYGISGYLNHIGESSKAEEYLKEVLSRKSVWPCISFLAAWNDTYRIDI